MDRRLVTLSVNLGVGGMIFHLRGCDRDLTVNVQWMSCDFFCFFFNRLVSQNRHFSLVNVKC